MTKPASANLIHCRDSGAGLPVILIHAFATDGTLWAPQTDALQERVRVIAPDLRGFGRSMPADGQSISMDRYADDIIDLMNALNIRQAVIGGISLGGYVALSLALRFPERTCGLILANTRAGADNPDWVGFREALLTEIGQVGARAVSDNYGDKPFRKQCPEDIKSYVREMMLRQPAAGLASATRGMTERPDRFAALGTIRVPTLIISGTDDQYIASTEGEAMHRAIAGSRFVDIDSAGHLSNIDSATAFNAAVSEFLEPIAKVHS